MARLKAGVIGVSVRECARQLGISDTAIHKARKAGRLAGAVHPDGSVDAEAVRRCMTQSSDPTRGGQREAGVLGVVQAQSAVQAQGSATGADVAGSLQSSTQLDLAPDAAGEFANVAVASGRAGSPAEPQPPSASLLVEKTKTERVRNIREQLALDKELGLVAEIEPMVRAIVDAMTAAKSELLALPDRLTPLVTPETNTGKVYDLIEAETKRICLSLEDKLKRMAQKSPVAA